MPKISLSESMRYLFPGVDLYLYLYILYPAEMGKFAETSGAIGFPLILGVVGSLIYFVYRPIIYDPIIERLQYKYNPFNANYRVEFMKRYKITLDQTTRLFVLIRDEYLKDKYTQHSMQGSGIHMLYQAGILSFLVGVLAFANDIQNKSIILIIFGFVVFVGGYLYDSKYEALERDMIMKLGWKKIDPIALNLGYTIK